MNEQELQELKQEETQRKLMQESLERLKLNMDFQILCRELTRIREILEEQIHDEEKTDTEIRRMLLRSNTIKLFLELPDDLLEQVR